MGEDRHEPVLQEITFDYVFPGQARSMIIAATESVRST